MNPSLFKKLSLTISALSISTATVHASQTFESLNSNSLSELTKTTELKAFSTTIRIEVSGEGGLTLRNRTQGNPDAFSLLSVPQKRKMSCCGFWDIYLKEQKVGYIHINEKPAHCGRNEIITFIEEEHRASGIGTMARQLLYNEVITPCLGIEFDFPAQWNTRLDTYEFKGIYGMVNKKNVASFISQLKAGADILDYLPNSSLFIGFPPTLSEEITKSYGRIENTKKLRDLSKSLCKQETRQETLKEFYDLINSDD